MYIVSDELYHHGILGQKWGLRRYQNKDGSLTDAGRVRYRGLAGKVRYIQDISKNKKRLKKMAEGRKRAAEIAKQTAENKKKWSKNAYDLEKHMDEYTPQEYAKAKADLLERESLRKIQMEEVRRGKEYFDTAANILVKGIDIYTKMSAASTAAETARNMKATADKTESNAALAIAKNAMELASLKKGEGSSGSGSNKPKEEGSSDSGSNKPKDEGTSDSGSNKPKDKGPSGGETSKNSDDASSSTENSSPRHAGNSSKETSSNSETRSSNSKTEPKPSFYSKLKEGAKKAADSFESMAEKTSSSGANETARAQAQAQNQAFSSSKESAPSIAKVKSYSNMKVDEAFDYIDNWTENTLKTGNERGRSNSSDTHGSNGNSFKSAIKETVASIIRDATNADERDWEKRSKNW